MKLWMDVMRDLESVMNDHERILDAGRRAALTASCSVHSFSALQDYRKMPCPLPPATSWRKRTIRIQRCTRDSASSHRRHRNKSCPKKGPC